ncbi:PE family protein, partial [Mycobacterium kansasii]
MAVTLWVVPEGLAGAAAAVEALRPCQATASIPASTV